MKSKEKNTKPTKTALKSKTQPTSTSAELPEDLRENLLELIRGEGRVNQLQLYCFASRNILTDEEQKALIDEFLRVGHLRNFLK